jgi:acyl transferase domain-containing protein/NADPH:quinone reductase-like Zn-dependent oxidoreductase/acyl carrier protein
MINNESNHQSLGGCDSAIAIVGLSCRFPGGGDSPENFWSALESGQTGIKEIPKERWDHTPFFHPDVTAVGRYYTKRAGILDDITGFDAEFFGISPREAEEMDPQQRLLLELSWESLERAGIPPEQIAGSNCAVYIGISATDYGNIRAEDLGSCSRYSLAGASLSIAANRISHAFDLRGNSMAIDTACSSSLVALHEGVRAIQDGSAGMALVGAVNMLISPYPFVGLSRAMMLSDYGECRAFSKTAKGYVRAEGGGVLVLKPLSQALKDGNPISAIIRAIGTNNDGRTPGISFPSAAQQESLLRGIYEKHGLDPEELVYLEAHGTGTSVGDPIEAQAIGRALGQLRRKSSLPIGSVKSNIGHLESASGMAGLIKAIGILKRGIIPPSLHTQELNPEIPFDELNIRVVTATEPILKSNRSILLGVNSFGFGGTNAHVVLQAPPKEQGVNLVADGGAPIHLPLSARTESSLKKSALQIAALLEGGTSVRDVAHTLALHRTHHSRRILLTAGKAEAAAESLRRYALGESDPAVVVGNSLKQKPGVVFVFAGHGAQGTDEGLRLMTQDPVLAPQVRRVDEMVRTLCGWSLIEQINWPVERREVSPIFLTQLVSFAIQAGVMKALLEKGLRPNAVAGHSFGEIPAAWAAGILTLEQAVMLIVKRSATQEVARGAGVMAAVSLDVARAEQEIARYKGMIEIATVNSPLAVTLVGDRASMSDLGTRLAAQDITFRILDLNYAFHSRFLDSGKESLLKELADLKPAQGEYAFYSSVSGIKESGEALTGEYWWRNLRESVRFDKAMGSLLATGHAIFIEIGGHPIMQAYMRHSLRALNAPGQPLCVIVKQTADGAARRVNETVARAYTLGASLDWAKNQPKGGQLVDLPSYSWERKYAWFPKSLEAAGPLSQPADGTLLGRKETANSLHWINSIDTQLYPFLAEYSRAEETLFPLGGYLEIMLEAASALHGSSPKEIQNLLLGTSLLLIGEQTHSIRTRYSEIDQSLSIESKPRLSEEPWILHAKARVIACEENLIEPLPLLPHGEGIFRKLTRPDLDRNSESPEWHESPTRGVIESATVTKVMAEAVLTPSACDLFLCNPAIVEGALKLLVAIMHEAEMDPVILLPKKIDRVLFTPNSTPIVGCRCVLREQNTDSVVADIDFLGAAGAAALSLRGVRCDIALPAIASSSASLYHVEEFTPLELMGRSPAFPKLSVWLESLPPIEVADLNAFVASLGEKRPYDPEWGNLLWKHSEFFAELYLAGVGGISHQGARRKMLFDSASTMRAIDQQIEQCVRLLAQSTSPTQKIRLLEVVSSEWAAELVIDRDRFTARRINSYQEFIEFSELTTERFDLLLLRQPALGGVDLNQVVEAATEMLSPKGLLVLSSYHSGRWADLVFGNGCLADQSSWREKMTKAGLSEIAFYPVSAGYLAFAEASANFAEDSRLPTVKMPPKKWLLAMGNSSEEESLAHDLAIHLVEAGHDIVFLRNENGWRVDELEIGFCFQESGAWQKVFREMATSAPIGVIYLNGLSLTEGHTEVMEEALWPLACMVQAISKSPAITPPSIVIVSAGAKILPSHLASSSARHTPHQAALWGFSRVIRNEHQEWNARIIDLHCALGDLTAMSRSLTDEILTEHSEDEVVRGCDRRFGIRIRAIDGPVMTKYRALKSVPMVASSTEELSIAATDSPQSMSLGRGQLRIEIHAFRIKPELQHGAQFEVADFTQGSGTVSEVGSGVSKFSVGDKVFFFSENCFATHTIVTQEMAEIIPSGMSLSQAATLPKAFFTAIYYLAHLAKMEPSERLLIHEAGEPTGLAGIQYGKYLSVEIFATVTSPEQRDLLHLLGLPLDHILDANSLSFADKIMSLTRGEGVDVVINSLKGEAMQKSLSLMRPFGRFVDLGKRDELVDGSLLLSAYSKNLSYHSVEIGQVLTKNPRVRKEIMRELLQLVSRGLLKPLPYLLYPAAQMSTATQRAKEEFAGEVLVSPPMPSAQPVSPAQHTEPLDGEGSYLITGGSSGLGLASTEVLVRLGARKIILVGRRNLESDEVKSTVEKFRRQGICIDLVSCDLADSPSFKSLIKGLRDQGHRIKGVIHAATLYDDGPIVSMTRSQLRRVLSVKAGAALDIQRLFANDHLDFLIFYSSISAVLGNPAQGNYAAANAVLDAIAQVDAVAQKNTLSIAWGAISDVGHLAREKELLASFKNQFGVQTLTAEKVFQELETCLLERERIASPHLLVGTMEWEMHSLRSACGVNRHARFREVAGDLEREKLAQHGIQEMMQGLSREEALSITLALLQEQVGEVLKMAPETLELDRSIAENGMDSLTTMELRILLEKKFGFELPLMLIREGVTIRQLAEKIRDFLLLPSEAALVSDVSQKLALKHGLSTEALDRLAVDKPNAASSKQLHGVRS